MHSNSHVPEPPLGDQPPEPKLFPQIVKSFDHGTINSDGYAEVSGFQRVVHGSDNVDSVVDNSIPLTRRKKVLIVGAGISGIQQAAILLERGDVRHEDIQIFDALDAFGGVWEKNKYPGCACDVPAMSYTTSFFVNTEYSHFFATREQIQEYYARFAFKYKLQNCTRFGSFVKSCSWDDDNLLWHVHVMDKATGHLQHWISDVVIQCVGSLDRPKFGNTPGREKYKGVSWHTAHWRWDYDLTGKHVGIIGCGPSIAQVIPEIVDKTASTTVYMRTPPVCLPRNDYAFSQLFRWAMRWIPGFAWFQRQRINIRMMINGVHMATDGSEMNDTLTKQAIDYMESQIRDPLLQDILRPYSKYLCKRPLRLDKFYPSLAKPNCTVVREQLITYTEDGIVSLDKSTGQEKKRKFDVIIYGTGFNVANFLDHELVTGINQLDLQEKWKEHPEALYGLATHGFPNMFFCFGPNSAHVFSIQQDNWERQARFNTMMVHEILKSERNGRKLAVHPARDVEHQYNNEVQIRQSGKFVWTRADCVTYYKNDAGWNTYTMPWTWWQWRSMLRKIRWEEWETLSKPATHYRPAWAS